MKCDPRHAPAYKDPSEPGVVISFSFLGGRTSDGPTPRLLRCIFFFGYFLFFCLLLGQTKYCTYFRYTCGKAEKTMWRITGDASRTDVAKEKSTQATDMIHPVDGKNRLQRFGESLDISSLDTFVWRVLELNSEKAEIGKFRIMWVCRNATIAQILWTKFW